MTNLTRLQAALAAAGIEAALLSDADGVGWATGFTGSFGLLLVTPTSARLLTDSRYAIQAKEQSDVPSFAFANPVSATEFLAEHVKAMGIARLAFEAGHATYETWQKWREALPAVEFVPLPPVLAPLRMTKAPEEIAKLRAACALADAAWEFIRRSLRPGATEYDVALELEFYIRRQGAAVAFPSIVVSGERSARPHGTPSERKFAAGDFITLDFGAKLDGFCSDITRTVVVGPPSERHRLVYGAVLEAQLAALEAMRPGVRAADVDRIARDVLARHELAEYFGHGLGHGLGRAVHDLGRLSPTSEDVLAVGQVWTVEPGVYIPEFGGVRIEDDVVVTETGIELLTHAPKALLDVAG